MLSPRIFSEIEKLYSQYTTEFKPMLSLVESVKVKFPITILNELRALQEHVFRCFSSTISEIEALEEINKAKGHLERAILDCYKELLVIYEGKLKDFEKSYEGINLALVKDGAFLIKYQEGWDAAQKLSVSARRTESEYFNDKLQAYAEYEKAVMAYEEVLSYIKECAPALIHVKACTDVVQVKERKRRRRENWMFAVISSVIGIVLGYILKIVVGV